MGDGSQNSDPWEPSSLWWSSHGIDSGPGLLAKHKESPCVHGTSGTLSVIRQKVWTKYADMHHTAVWAMQTGYNFIQYWHYSTLMYFIINKQQEHFLLSCLICLKVIVTHYRSLQWSCHPSQPLSRCVDPVFLSNRYSMQRVRMTGVVQSYCNYLLAKHCNRGYVMVHTCWTWLLEVSSHWLPWWDCKPKLKLCEHVWTFVNQYSWSLYSLVLLWLVGIQQDYGFDC